MMVEHKEKRFLYLALAYVHHQHAAYAARRRHGEGVALRQEQDVLDTWFSSGLWCVASLTHACPLSGKRQYEPSKLQHT
jgi:valyl-tRNA synthetase